MALPFIAELPVTGAFDLLDIPAWQPTPAARAARARADERTGDHAVAALSSLLTATVGAGPAAPLPDMSALLSAFLDGAVSVFSEQFGSGLPSSGRSTHPAPSDLPSRYEWTARLGADVLRHAPAPLSVPWPLWLTKDASRLFSPAVVCGIEGWSRLAAAGAAASAPRVAISKVVDARIVSTSTIWDGTARRDDLHLGRAVAHEVGRCISLSTEKSHLSILDRVATPINAFESWLPVHERAPAQRVAGSVTVAFVCRETVDGVRVGTIRPRGWRGNREGLDTSTADVGSKENSDELLTVHALTFDAIARTERVQRSLLLRKLRPAPLDVVVGWTLSDIDGHFSATGGRSAPLPVLAPAGLGGNAARVQNRSDSGAASVIRVLGTGDVGDDVAWPIAWTHPAIAGLRGAAASAAAEASAAAIAATIEKARLLAPYFAETAGLARAWGTALIEIAEAAETCGVADSLIIAPLHSAQGAAPSSDSSSSTRSEPDVQRIHVLAGRVLTVVANAAAELGHASRPGWTPWSARIEAAAAWEAAADAAEGAGREPPPRQQDAESLPPDDVIYGALEDLSAVTGIPPTSMSSLYLRGRAQMASTWDELHVRQSDIGCLLAAQPFGAPRAVVRALLDRVEDGLHAAKAAGVDVNELEVRLHRLRAVPAPAGGKQSESDLADDESPRNGEAQGESLVEAELDSDAARLRRWTTRVPNYALALRSLLVDAGAAGALPRSPVRSGETAL